MENNLVCYYHPDRPAVGLCKHCQRGLCSDCATPVDDSLACKNRHEEQVHEWVELTKQNILKSRRTRSDYLRNATFYGTVGLLFTAFGISQIQWQGLQGIVYAVIGLALLYAALANYLESRKYK